MKRTVAVSAAREVKPLTLPFLQLLWFQKNTPQTTEEVYTKPQPVRLKTLLENKLNIATASFTLLDFLLCNSSNKRIEVNQEKDKHHDKETYRQGKQGIRKKYATNHWNE